MAIDDPVRRVPPGYQVPADSRFSRIIVVGNPLDQLQASTRATRKWTRKVAVPWRERKLGYHGEVRRDDAFRLDVDFSDDDGASFTSPLVGVTGNRTYQLRLTLSQLHASPLIRGFSTRWILPGGWAFTDGLPATIHDAAVSNPLVVTRVVRSPLNPEPAPFEIRVTEVFR